MPVYKSRTVLELAKDLRAFLNLEAGLLRGPVRGRQQAGAARGPFGPLAADASFRPLRVAQVALDDGRSGGGRAAYRLHAALRRLGHNSSMFVANKHSGDATVCAFEAPADPENREKRRARREEIRRDFGRYDGSRPENLVGYGFTEDRSEYAEAPQSQIPECDVINLHWFGGLLDYRVFFGSVPGRPPVVWTLHDMNAFTGGCHWDAGCGRFEDACGACPQLGSDEDEDLSRESWRRKREAFAGLGGDRLHLVSPSRWLAGVARRSSLLGGFPVSTIPNSLDTQVFAPRNRELAREAIGVAPDAAMLLFAADSLVTVRKGFALLAEAIRGLADVPNLTLVTLGGFNPASVRAIPHKHLGFVEDDLLLSGVYSAADLFVIPSLQDNLPQTAMEAMACGTPVVGFDAGGIQDIVRPGSTGELVPVKSVDGLRAGIRTLLDNPERRAKMSGECRRVVLEKFSYDAQAGRYVDLYRSMLRAPGRV